MSKEVERSMSEIVNELKEAASRASPTRSDRYLRAATAIETALTVLKKVQPDINTLDKLPPSIQSQQNIRLINAWDAAVNALGGKERKS